MSVTIAIILVAAVLIGSLSWVLPSPRERKQMELREAAMKAGLKIKTTDLDTVIDARTSKATHCIAYGLSRVEPIGTPRWQVTRERQTDEPRIAHQDLPSGWHWSVGDLPAVAIRQYIHSVLQTLNNDVLAIESNPISCIIYWCEHGSVMDVEQFASLLKELDRLEHSLS